MYRFVHSHERHEKIALAVPDTGYGATADPLPSDGHHPTWDPAAAQPGDGDAPIHRYMADMQPYEWLALGLDQPDQHQPGFEQQEFQAMNPFASASHGSSLEALEEGEEDTEMNEEMMRLRLYVDDSLPLPPVCTELTCSSPSYDQQRVRALGGQPRLTRTHRKRVNSSSPQPGHRDKMAKRT